MPATHNLKKSRSELSYESRAENKTVQLKVFTTPNSHGTRTFSSLMNSLGQHYSVSPEAWCVWGQDQQHPDDIHTCLVLPTHAATDQRFPSQSSHLRQSVHITGTARSISHVCSAPVNVTFSFSTGPRHSFWTFATGNIVTSQTHLHHHNGGIRVNNHTITPLHDT